MKEQTRYLLSAFLDGFTGAGLFRKLYYPGAPEHFIDPRPVEEIIASGEFEEACRRFLDRHNNQTKSL